MKQEIIDKLAEVKSYISNISEIVKCQSLAYWDLKINMPKDALESRSNTLAYLAGEEFKLTTSDKVKEFIDYFNPIMDELDIKDKAMINNLKKNYEQIKKIPEDRYTEFKKVCALSEAAWQEAKEKKDFKIFEPHLEKVVAFSKEFADYYGYEDCRYDALLNEYEEGLTVKKLDKIFGELKNGIMELLDYIKQSSEEIDSDFLYEKFDVEKQKEVSQALLDVIKFDKNKGRLDETEHPFTLEIGNKDIRITTHYYENDLFSNIFSVIHEGGHGLYEMHISDELIGTGLDTGVSMAIHESQSRFYENIVGRSKPFLAKILPVLKEKFPQLNDITVDKLYRAVNKVEPSLIRTQADELTYSLHIIIRYEIEKQLINGEIEVKDLPRVWKEKYEEYLGVTPKDDAEGVLQDMHWSDGSIGYFPSYALGNVYGGQLLNVMKQDNLKAVEEADIDYINDWLSNKIHKHGSVYTPNELILNISGEELNPKYFLNYLNNKYKNIY